MAEDDDEEETSGEVSRIIGVFAGCNRRSRWWLAPRTSVISACARSFLDLRQVETYKDASIIEISVTCVFGSVTIVVPDGTNVTLSGMSFLASSNSEIERSTEPSFLPRVIVNANTLFGRMKVRTADDDELAEDATDSLAAALTAARAADSGDEAGEPVDAIGADRPAEPDPLPNTGFDPDPSDQSAEPPESAASPAA